MSPGQVDFGLGNSISKVGKLVFFLILKQFSAIKIEKQLITMDQY
jgi:hypothetical protein